MRRRLLIASAIIALALPAVPALAEEKPASSPDFMLQYFERDQDKQSPTLQLEQAIGGVKVGATASFQKPDSKKVAAGEDEEELGVGLRLGFGGFSIEGAYKGVKGESSGPKKSFGASVGYSGGPFSATVGYVYDEDILAGKEKDAVQVGAIYRISPGIAAHGSLQYSEEGSAVEKTDGVAVTGGIALSF